MATTRKNTETGHGNNQGSLAQALSNALEKKARGNSFFGEGKYNKATEEYIYAIRVAISFSGSPNPDITSLMVVLRSYLAACYLKMEQYRKGVQEATAALAIDPLHHKSYTRLCKAQYLLKEITQAVETMAVVVALTLPRP